MPKQEKLSGLGVEIFQMVPQVEIVIRKKNLQEPAKVNGRKSKG
jgi:hypothetical protein